MRLFVALPHLQVRDKPMILLDITRREFTFFGFTFPAHGYVAAGLVHDLRVPGDISC
ncbi:MAG: hypothetical protein R3C12_16425 [Planctomycetaceae bacterium]